MREKIYFPKDLEPSGLCKRVRQLESEHAELERQNKGFQEQYNETGIEVNKLRDKLQIAIDELQVVAEWKDAYPEDIFPPIGTDTYHMMCKASGISVDRVSAHVLRKIVKAYSEAAEKTLSKLKDNQGGEEC